MPQLKDIIKQNKENKNKPSTKLTVTGNSKYHSNFFSYYSFQPEAVQFLINRKHALLALPTGTGKTLVSISSYAYLKEQNPNLQLIFITDKSVVQQADRSVQDYTLLRSQYIYGDTKKQRNITYKEFKNKELDVLILNYAMLRTDVEEFEEIFETVGAENIMLICDEANALARLDSKIHLIVKNIAQYIPYCYFLTATVSKGKLEDYYNLIYCMHEDKHTPDEFRDLFGEYSISISAVLKDNSKTVGYGFTQYAQDYIYVRFSIKDYDPDNLIVDNESEYRYIKYKVLTLKLKRDKWDEQRTSVAIIRLFNKKTKQHIVLHATIRGMYKMTGYKNLGLFLQEYGDLVYSKAKKELAPNLPAFTKIYINVEEDKTTHTAISELYKMLDYEPNHSQLNVALTLPEYVDEKYKGHSNNKIQALLDILKNKLDEDEKTIIYHSSKKVINFAYAILTAEGYKCSRITGDIVKEREEQKELFKTENQIMLITDAGGVGVDSLQVSGNIIFLGMPITGGQYAQICGRISRINTEKTKLTLYHILTDNSYDTDRFISVMSQINLMYFLDKNSIDDGLLDPHVKTRQSEQEADVYIKQQIWSRRGQYK